LIALSVWFQSYCRGRGEMGTTLALVAGFEAAPPPRIMILPAKAGPAAFAYDMQVALPGFDTSETVGATARNIELAQQYLYRAAGRWTIHTVPAWNVAPYVYDRLLLPEAALRARADMAEATGSLLATTVLTAKIAQMPPSDALTNVGARLRDANRFHAGSQATVRLQAEALVARDRSLNGTVAVAGNPDGVRIALYRQATGDAPSRVPTALQLVAAATPDAKGRFFFEGLPPSFYSVGVLLPASLGADPRRLTVQGTLHVVDLSSDRKREDVGTVRVGAAIEVK